MTIIINIISLLHGQLTKENYRKEVELIKQSTFHWISFPFKYWLQSTST